jgi:hypothetical protein
LRNALSTFGPESIQYRNIKLMVDEHVAKLAFEGLSLSSTQRIGDGDERMQMM